AEGAPPSSVLSLPLPKAAYLPAPVPVQSSNPTIDEKHGAGAAKPSADAPVFAPPLSSPPPAQLEGQPSTLLPEVEGEGAEGSQWKATPANVAQQSEMTMRLAPPIDLKPAKPSASPPTSTTAAAVMGGAKNPGPAPLPIVGSVSLATVGTESKILVIG